MKNLLRGAIPQSAESASHGLHVLVDKDPDGEGVVDVVAVHGLNGHYEGTWTTALHDRTQINWLKDMLPKIGGIKPVRVMSFSYNSSVQFSKSTSDVFVFADQLLEHLLAKRAHSGETRRPIVFICHSLGGIVVKQAVNRAAENHRYKDVILDHVQGICFFGTPHRGSELAPWGSTVSRILRAGVMGSHTNSQLTKDLERKSHMLSQISKSFLQHGRRLKIVSFTETEKLDWLNCLVVDPDSATLAWPGEIVVPIDGNHRNICRFIGPKDPKFAPVESQIKQMIGKKASTVITGNVIGSGEIMTALWSNYESHKARNPTAVFGTCSWILRHPKMQAWEKSPHRSLLWHSANAGCGKSVMASFLIDHFKRNAKTDTDVCYFFFKDDSMEQSNAVIGVSAFLHQLYSAHPELTSLARKQLNGLDECDETSRKQLMALMAEYFKRSAGEPEARNLKILVLSRPDNSIQMMFDRQAPKMRSAAASGEISRYNMMRLRGEDETNAISQDIELVAQDAMQDLADRGIPEDFLVEIERELVSRADRTFLWTALIIQLLKDKAVEGASRREMNAILRSRSVYSIYTALLDSKTGNTPHIKRKARKMLSLILAAMRPLTVEEVNIALAVKPDLDALTVSKSRPKPSKRTFHSVEYELVYPPENHIKSLCGHFVRIIQGRVYLVHQTAREFLLDQSSIRGLFEISPDFNDDDSDGGLWDCSLSDSDTEQYEPSTTDSVLTESTKAATLESDHAAEPDWQHSFSLERCHASLLEICTTYLYMLGKPCNDTALGQPAEKVALFLAYAASYWVVHFHQVCERILPADLSYYHGLCHPRFPGFTTWLEAYDGEGRQPIFASGSVDEQQDMIIEKFALEPGHPRFGKEFTTEVDLTRIFAAGESHRQILSCNPSQAQNLNFPVKVDETGVVKLDFELVGKAVIGRE
ncbi:hypothetical protein M406DRAFT_351665 [Cryphonectria parasitica EP155]|uniref:DUF676 domain-containing protein n=1 Tax=Cryphonectria parasitica (strain ATCC 38755 / EP155) TaxID=660469 RepID=A0A9P5CMN4_CRYP1|nr:uncharacterized protein M406DRAFT_351665 [Cryphonectria parasitica EP155]KAF3764298.1 hypothetical protein M406DRAFT_351665 [Cryphonectria parasitica EP155]